MWVAGEYISKADPRHFPGRYDTWEQADAARGQNVSQVSPTPANDNIPGEDLEFNSRTSGLRSFLYKRVDRAWDEDPAGYVYIAQQKHRDDLVKVGHSKTPRGRLASWNTGLPPEEEFRMVQVLLVADRFEAEKAMHHMLSLLRVVGRRELFRTHVEVARLAMALVELMEEDDAA
jgi:hypothetical protein